MPKKTNIKTTQEQQLVGLRYKYGSMLTWVDVTLPMTHQEVTDYFGKQCKDYEPTCACCKAWIEWQTCNQKVTVTVERNSIIRIMKEEAE